MNKQIKEYKNKWLDKAELENKIKTPGLWEKYE